MAPELPEHIIGDNAKSPGFEVKCGQNVATKTLAQSTAWTLIPTGGSGCLRSPD